MGGIKHSRNAEPNDQTLLFSIQSPAVGTCDCYGEPAYDPAHQLARTIFAALPPIPSANVQNLYDEIVGHIEEAFGQLPVLADEFEGDEDVKAVN
jgi:hypothetical protein